MSCDKNILAVITARGGSKGLPGKNIKELGGKPLIVWSIREAEKSKHVSHLIVSTDDQKIADVAQQHGASVPFMRPKELAEDSTLHLPVMQHATAEMERQLNLTFDYIVILQPTSPFRKVEDLDACINLIIKTGADSAATVIEVEGGSHPMKMKRYEGNRVTPYLPEWKGSEETRRQDLSPVYKRSGDVYVMRRDLIMKQNQLYGDHVVGHLIPREENVNIDDEFDWLRAEYLLKKQQEKHTNDNG